MNPRIIVFARVPRAGEVISIGTSLEVEPAADLPHLAKRSGSRVIIVNRQPTVVDKIADLVIHDDAAKALPALVRALRR